MPLGCLLEALRGLLATTPAGSAQGKYPPRQQACPQTGGQGPTGTCSSLERSPSATQPRARQQRRRGYRPSTPAAIAHAAAAQATLAEAATVPQACGGGKLGWV